MGTRRSLIVIAVMGACLALGALFISVSPAPAVAESTRVADTPLASADLTVLRRDNLGVLIELRVPEPDWITRQTPDGPCTAIAIPGMAALDRSGWPDLPVRGATVAVPPEGKVAVAEIAVDVESYKLDHPPCPVPSPQMFPNFDIGVPAFGGFIRTRDPAAYGEDAYWPSSGADLVALGWVRDVRVAQVRLMPVQVNPATGRVRVARTLRVRIAFESDVGVMHSSATPPRDDSLPFDLDAVLLNPDQARTWRGAPDDGRAVTRLSATQAVSPAIKMSLDAEGLYVLTYGDLDTAGLDAAGLDPRTFRVLIQGEEVALHVEGEADGTWDPGDRIRFYGWPADTRYVASNVAWLTWGGATGLRMETEAGVASDGEPLEVFTTTARWEENRYYQANVPGGDASDHWYGSILQANAAPVTRTFSMALNHVVTGSHSATLCGELFGFSEWGPAPDHHTQVFLNGHQVDDATWDGWRIYNFCRTVPASSLVEGVNEIAVVLPFDLGPDVLLDTVFVNWFDLDYRRAYTATNDHLAFAGTGQGAAQFTISGFATETLALIDVTDAHHPMRILSPTVEAGPEGVTLAFSDTLDGTRHYLALSLDRELTPANLRFDVPSTLRVPDNGADYLIIAHGDFITAVQPLADHRAAQGLRVAVVDVQDVYDEFNGGLMDQSAIRDFLAYAYANWTSPAPMYVVLVGDGTYDPRDYKQRGETVYVPPYLASVDPWFGETAADNRYVCVSGDDILPDMHLGRLPVKTATEAETVVDKLIAYETDPASGGWRQRMLFVADNPDDGGDFYALSDLIADRHVPDPYVTDKVYLGKSGYESASDAKQAIIQAIDAGRLMVNYIGHAAQDLWAFENPHLLTRDDVEALDNGGRLPFVVPMTCLDGYYIHPSFETYDLSATGEAFVRQEGGGAIASWSPTGLGIATGHDYLNRALFDAIFYQGVTRLGPATTQAKYYLYSQTAGYRELLDTYLLFGDPATRLNVLKTDLALTQTVATPDRPVRPGDPVTVTLTYTNAGPATAHHVVLTGTLPAALISPTFVSSGAPITLRAGSRFVWDVADLAAGQGGVVSLTAQISPTFAGVFTHTARIATTAVETDTANNVAAPVRIGVGVPDLILGKHGPAQVYPHDRLTYTLTYTNAGSALAPGVVLTDVLPSELFSVTITAAGAAITPRVGSRVVWDVADLAPGTGGTLTVTAHLTSTATGVFANTARIVTSAPELSIADNRARVTTAVVWHTLYLPLVTK